jgi:uncharacterized membrane protein YphA (DoxX/SURF4 family)
MDTALWIVQWVLAVAFLISGLGKLLTPEDRLRNSKNLKWIEDTGVERARIAGEAEVPASLGLILPSLTGIAPILTPLAAIGLAIVMLLAARLHTRRNEPQIRASIW